MNRYSTLPEDIQRINNIAGVTQAKPPCGCDKPEDDKEIITSASMEESTDQDKYEDVVFMQGQEADEPLRILDQEGEDAALEYLKTWHMVGSHMGSDKVAHAPSDLTYKKDGYIMSWNPHIGYIGLQYDLNHGSQAMAKQALTPLKMNEDNTQRMREINKFLLKS